MGKKIAVFYILFFSLSITYANRGNSLTYKFLDYVNSDENFTPKSFIEDFQNFLNSYYSVTMEKSENSIIKYDFKKFSRLENTISIKKHDIYI